VSATIGYCTSDLAKAKAAGFDFAEIGIRDLVKLSDEDFDTWVAAHHATGLPTPAGYLFLPAEPKIVGPDVDHDRLMAYVRRAFERCERLGVRTIVFGAPDARRAPSGFATQQAFAQLVQFGRAIAPLAAARGIVLGAEAICAAQTNMINTTAEALAWVDAVSHPSFQFMVDLFHLVQQGEDTSMLRQVRGPLAYAKIANPQGRLLPLPADGYDYEPYLSVLREMGYAGPLGMEATVTDLDGDGPRSIAFLKAAWPQARSIPGAK
jgi:sugar phosphate isomerase/epimerase